MNEQVEAYSRQFSQLEPPGMLAILIRDYPSGVVFSSSLGVEDQVITHMLVQQGMVDGIFTLDTGRLFPETYDLIERTNARYGIKVNILFPETESVERITNERGVNLFYHSIENRKLCCHIRKIEPLRRALSGNAVWITGLRREQSPTRLDLDIVEWDSGNQIIKVNPLLHWSEKDVWDYVKRHGVPYNSLHDKGFPSIGCQPCTRAVLPGEDIRSGRWWWENPESRECGLHPLRGNQRVV